MSINIEQLELNVNLYALQPDFLNSELHYVIAQSENSFRFARWNEEPENNEKKFYCFLTEQELFIPAGNISLKQSYVLKENAVYPIAANYPDFAAMIETLQEKGIAKAIRRFLTEDIEAIKEGLEEKSGAIEKHIVTSRHGQHILLVFDDKEISISDAMVYFRKKSPFNKSHYDHVKEEK